MAAIMLDRGSRDRRTKLPFHTEPREDPMMTRWFNSWEDMIQEQPLAVMDVLAFDRGLYKHYAIVIDADENEYFCVDLQKSSNLLGCGPCCVPVPSTASKSGELRRVPLSLICKTGEQGSASVQAIQNANRKQVQPSKIRICNKFPLKDGWRDRLDQLTRTSESVIYNVLKHNCEHFANYVRSEKRESEQVRNGVLTGIGITAAVIGGVALLFNMLTDDGSKREEEENEKRGKRAVAWRR